MVFKTVRQGRRGAVSALSDTLTPKDPFAEARIEFMEPVTLTSSRRKLALMVAAASAFIVGGLAMASGILARPFPASVTVPMGWISLVFGGFGLVSSSISFIRPTRLRLESGSFIVESAFRRSSVRWSDIDRFLIWEHPGGKFAAFNYLDDRRPTGTLQSLNTAMGVDEILPNTLNLEAGALVDLMNDWRLKCAAREVPVRVAPSSDVAAESGRG